MKASAIFALVVAIGVAILVTSGCGGVGPAPVGAGPNAPPPATPPAKWLYADHNGTFYAYRLPLTAASKPARTLSEWPGLGVPPSIAVGPYGDVAVASLTEIRIFTPPIVSFKRSHAELSIPLTPAITQVGPYGADLVDMEYDPNGNLWLFNNLGGGGISELRTPFSKNMVASLTLGFGAPGSKTAGYTMSQGRFDVNAALYIYALAVTRARLFKLSFPYAKQPSSLGIDLDQADVVDSSQYLPTSENPASVLLGQYTGALRTPKPGSPPSPPVDVLGQFDEPLMPVNGLIPNDHANSIVGALVADPPRELFYTLLLTTGKLQAFNLPLRGGAKPVISVPCLAGPSNCTGHEHLFLAP
jgi:hypothetical protein